MSDISIVKIYHTNLQLKEVIKLSIGLPTNERVNKVLLSYKNHGELIGAFIDDKLVACLGYNIDFEQLVIRHLSVVNNFQNKKIGTKLISYVLSFEGYKSIYVVTDADAKGFYEKLKFKCNKVDSDFEVDRFECRLLRRSENEK